LGDEVFIVGKASIANTTKRAVGWIRDVSIAKYKVGSPEKSLPVTLHCIENSS
jgi:hypothetical protein